MNRKASLNLSIQAIVIVVIAFVVLGLGLGFVRGVFDQSTSITDEAFTSVAANLKDDIAKSNDQLYFPQDTIVLEANEETVKGLGIKNLGDLPGEFRVEFYVRVDGVFQPFTPGVIKEFGSGETAFTAGIDWDNTAQSLNQRQGVPIPFAMTAPSKFGNYLYKIKVVKGTDNEYASKTFFVRTA